MADTLIVNGIVVTIDGQRRVIEDGAVAIEKDRIVAVGPTSEVTSAHSAPKVIDARGKAVMPGLVDGHAHAGHGLIKTMGGGNGALWYRPSTLWPRPRRSGTRKPSWPRWSG
jgi:5-methylthioadenosine/S-adenosylhomocysteine deaminase